MKKIIALSLCLLTSLSLVACGPKEPTNNPGAESGEKAGDTMVLTEMVDKLYEGIDPETLNQSITTTELNEEMFEFVSFAKYREGVTGVVSEPMMSSIAHSIVIVRANDAAEAAEIAAEIDANKNPAKWICVEAEKSVVKVNGSTILLVMSTEAVADAVIANFDALWA